MIDARGQKKLKRSKRRVGSYYYYYYPEQQSVLQKKINNILTQQDKEMIQKLLDKNVISEGDVNPQEVAILSGLEDLIRGFTVEYDNKLLRCWSAPNIAEDKARDLVLKKLGPVEPKVEEKPPEVVEKKPVPKPVPPKVEEKPKKVQKKISREEKKETELAEELKAKVRKEILAELKGSFRDNVLHWLEKQNIDVIEERVVKEGQEAELEVKVPTPLGRQSYLVRILDYTKKSASQNDLSTIGMDAVAKRIPAIIISSTGFAKTAIKFWKKELENMVTLMSEEDLE